MKSDFLLAITQLAAEKNLPKDVVLTAIEAALEAAYKKENFATNQHISVKISPSTGLVEVWAEKKVVGLSSDRRCEISLAEAQKIKEDVKIGDTIMVESTPANARKIAAQTAKQVILQRLREAEHSVIFEEFTDREGEVVTGLVQRIELGQVYIDLGRIEAILPASEQVRTERYRVGQRLKFILLQVAHTTNGPGVIVSRSHPDLLRRLFELEVPEIYNGTVEIKSIAREPGFRSKIAVVAKQEGIDPVGCCVGLRGIRIQNIVNELSGEKIDVVQWNPEPAAFVANALRPAHIVSVELNKEERAAIVIVPDKQLSLAIGKNRQNSKLAAKLTGWRIDIKSTSMVETEKATESKATDVGGEVVTEGATEIVKKDRPQPTARFASQSAKFSSLPPVLESRYYDAELIGQGGFAQVFRARKKKEGKVVAVKIPIRLDEVTGKNFIKEIRVWESLKHDNIVECYDCNILPIPYLELEYVDGGTIEDIPKPLEIEKAARIALGVARGLRYAHNKLPESIIHRDLKPSNILLTSDLMPKISDWGLSKIAAESRTSSFSGFSSLYAAPEQISSKKFGPPDKRTDVYQLGVILYELVTGRLPFSGDDVTEVISQIVSEEPTKPSLISAGTDDIEPVVLKCLAKRKEERYQNIEELEANLVGYLKSKYKCSLKESRGNMTRSAYYCAQLFLLHARLGEVAEALQYCLDLKNYAKETEEITQLASELQFRIDQGSGVGDSFIQRASVIAHQVMVGFME